jgi:hypothetical protein
LTDETFNLSIKITLNMRMGLHGIRWKR